MIASFISAAGSRDTMRIELIADDPSSALKTSFNIRVHKAVVLSRPSPSRDFARSKVFTGIMAATFNSDLYLFYHKRR